MGKYKKVPLMPFMSSTEQISTATTTVGGISHGEFPTYPIEVTVGGATVFVLTVDQFLKV